jgi:hypothetical protein
LPPNADAPTRHVVTGQGYVAFARNNPAHFRRMFKNRLGAGCANPCQRSML